MTQQQVRFSIVGLGGYGQVISDLILRLQASDPELCVLKACCDPDLITNQPRANELKSKGVSVVDSIDALLKIEADVTWLPVPIDLHLPFTKKCLDAGRAVVCEKPPAGSIQELLQMQLASTRSGKPLLFGYQDIYDPITLDLKKRILAGEIGEVRQCVIHACWPRDSVYYSRNNWAGKFKRGKAWVMDSPINNALAHPINQALFLLGSAVNVSADPIDIEAELYRANDIENFDTVALRSSLDTGPKFLVLMTHACQKNIGPVTTIVGTKGSIEMTFSRVVMIVGPKVVIDQPRSDKMKQMVETICHVIKGHTPKTAVATPATCVPHLKLVNGASAAALIHTIDSSHIDVHVTDRGGLMRSIHNIDSLITTAAQGGLLFSEVHNVPWTKPASKLDLRRFNHFDGPKLFQVS